MVEININELMKILNGELKKLVPFNKKFDVFLQKGGVGCYDIEKWAIFIPDSLDTSMKIYVILHEGAHLILREKLSNLIEPKKFERLKWSMEPFMIDNSVFSLDESFAELVTNTIMSKFTEDFFRKEIIFDKFSNPSYKSSNEKLDIFLAKISEWKIPISLKNNNLNISNTMNNLTFLEPNERIKVILDALSILKNQDYKTFIKKVIENPLENSPTIKLFSRITNSNAKICSDFKMFDAQIFLDYLETLSWIDYTEDYYIYSNFITKKNLTKPKRDMIKDISNQFNKLLLEVSRNLNKIRKEMILAWNSKDEPKLKKLVKDYNLQRWRYRRKVNLNNDFNRYGFGVFKWV